MSVRMRVRLAAIHPAVPDRRPTPASSYRSVVTAGGSALAEVELLAHR